MAANPVNVEDWTVVTPAYRPQRLRRSWKSIRDAHYGRLRAIVVAGNEATAAEAKDLGAEAVAMNPGRFIMSRAWNLGLAQVKTPYAFLVEDDAFLMTPFGIDEMVRISADMGDRCILAPALKGDVLGHQIFAAGAPWEMTDIQPADFTLVAALLPMDLYRKVGPFDEGFTGYGYDDTDYAIRSIDSGYRVTIYQRVVVNHESFLSGYRERPELGRLAFESKCHLVEKYGRRVMAWIR